MAVKFELPQGSSINHCVTNEEEGAEGSAGIRLLLIT